MPEIKRQYPAPRGDGLMGLLIVPLNLLLWLPRRVLEGGRRQFMTIGLVLAFLLSGLYLFGGGRLVMRAGVMVDNGLVALGVRVRDVTVSGRNRTPRATLIAALGVAVDGTILRLDLAEMRARVVALPWVKSVRIERRLPDIVHVALQERVPFALKREGRRLTLFDEGGAVILPAPRGFSHLPIFEGRDAERHARALLQILQAYPSIRSRLIAAKWVGQRRWDMQLDSGSLIMLPEAAPARALARLVQVERARHVLAVKQVIDLRLPDRVLLRGSKLPMRRVARKGSSL